MTETRPADITLPEGWTWDHVEAQRAKWSIDDNMVPVATGPGVVAWITINAARADQAEHKRVEDEAAEPKMLPFWTVAIYVVDQAWGGPEEGGWWYQYGQRQDQPLDGIASEYLLTVWSNEAVAASWSRSLQEKLDATVNVGRREISSVLSTGRYNAQVYNGYPPAHYPETRPHYE